MNLSSTEIAEANALFRRIGLLMASCAVALCATGCSRSPKPVIIAAPTVEATPSQPASKPRHEPYPFKRVVLVSIGINQYEKLRGTPDLRFAQADAEAVAGVLKNHYGYEVIPLYGENATKREIELTLKKLGQVLGKEDALVVFFAGHGQVIPLSSGDEAGYLIPFDADLDLNDKRHPDQWAAQALEMQYLSELIEAMNARHVLFIADACCSGFMTKRGALDRADLKTFLFEKSRTVFTATTRRQAAREDKDAKHGYFTDALVEQLHKDDAASVIDIYLPVLHSVAAKTNGRMTPQIGHFGDGDGMFVFIPKSIPKSQIESDLNGQTLENTPARGLAGVLTRERQRLAKQTTEAQMLETFDALDYRFALNAEAKKAEWEKKFTRFRENAGLGDVWAMAALYRCYEKGLGTAKDPNEAYHWARQAARFQKPSGVGRFLLGRCYELGIGVEKNTFTADDLLRESAKQGFPLAEAALGAKIMASEPNVEEAIQAKKVLEKAASSGVSLAYAALGDAYWNGRPGVPKDILAAVRLYHSAADRGRLQALMPLYLAYIAGKPGYPEKDLGRAEEYLRRAAEAGVAVAQREYGLEYYHGETRKQGLSLQRDLTKAHSWLKLAADQNDSTALFSLAWMTSKGEGVATNYVGARELCERAVKLDFAPALRLQAIWYADGTIYPRDDAKAFACFHQAAQKGDMVACERLATMYDHRRGLPEIKGEEAGAFVADHWTKVEALHWHIQATLKGSQSSPWRVLRFHEELTRANNDFAESIRNPRLRDIARGKDRSEDGLWVSLILTDLKTRYPESAKEYERIVRPYTRRETPPEASHALIKPISSVQVAGGFDKNGAIFSPDGKWLAFRDGRETGEAQVHVFEVANGKEQLTLACGYPFAFLADGKRLAGANATGEEAGRVHYWDCTTGEQVKRTDPTRYVRLCVSPAGSAIAAVGSDTKGPLHTFLTNQLEVGSPDILTEKNCKRLVFSSDGSLLAAGDDIEDRVRLWNVKTRKEIPCLARGKLVALLDEGATLITENEFADGAFNKWREGELESEWWEWDVGSGQRRKRISIEAGHSKRAHVRGVFSPDNRTIVSFGPTGEAFIRDRNSGAIRVALLIGKEERLEWAEFSPNGKVLATGSKDGSLKLWKIDGNDASTSGRAELPAESSVRPDETVNAPREWANFPIGFQFASRGGDADHLAFSANGRAVFLSSEHHADVKVWDVELKVERLSLGSDGRPWGRALLSPDGRILVRPELPPKRAFAVIDVGTGDVRQPNVNGIPYGFSPDSKYLVLYALSHPGPLKTSLCLMDLASFEVTASLEAPPARVVVWAPDAKLVAALLRTDLTDSSSRGRTRSSDNARLRIVLLDPTTLTVKATLGKDRVMALGGKLTFSPDGKYLVLAGMRELNKGAGEIWDVQETWNVEEKTARLLPGAPLAFVGSRLLAVHAEAGLDLYDAATGRIDRNVAVADKSARRESTCTAFCSGTQFYALGNRQGEVILWDLVQNKLVAILNAHSGQVRALAFSPDARFLASVGADNTLKIWKLSNETKSE